MKRKTKKSELSVKVAKRLIELLGQVVEAFEEYGIGLQSAPLEVAPPRGAVVAAVEKSEPGETDERHDEEEEEDEYYDEEYYDDKYVDPDDIQIAIDEVITVLIEEGAIPSLAKAQSAELL